MINILAFASLAICAPTNAATGQAADRIYLSAALEACQKKQAQFYMEPSGMDGPDHTSRIYTMAGKLKAEGRYADAGLTIPNGQFTFYHENGQVESKGRYEMGLKSGVWERYDDWGRALAEKIYNPDPLKDILYTQATSMPQYPGGQKELVSYLKDRVNGQDGINAHGKLTTSFVVERDGTLTDIKVIDGDDGKLDERVVNALKASPPWDPGVERGQPVRVQVRVPVPY